RWRRTPLRPSVGGRTLSVLRRFGVWPAVCDPCAGGGWGARHLSRRADAFQVERERCARVLPALVPWPIPDPALNSWPFLPGCRSDTSPPVHHFALRWAAEALSGSFL